MGAHPSNSAECRQGNNCYLPGVNSDAVVTVVIPYCHRQSRPVSQILRRGMPVYWTSATAIERWHCEVVLEEEMKNPVIGIVYWTVWVLERHQLSRCQKHKQV